jgi:hypothetical protein
MKDMHMMDMFAHTARLLILSLDMNRFVNEAAKCLEDGIIDNPVVGDIGLVFEPALPLSWRPVPLLDQVGVSNYVDTRERLCRQVRTAVRAVSIVEGLCGIG